ncbi:peptide MFS transporter [Corynebacterium afermentans]|uniref:peptide MFS transporter n=1 Tax=Corynebacterium afermentans TaxID=38286 RepID=UPI002573BF44|nr:peptide MFS transporter [Corynebacterium afermentans]MCG7291311.1 peptide MFS transporter [Corynebacterium afermentans]
MTSVTQPGAAVSQTERKFFGQPWGLANLFGIELWERFSFYGMQALLAYYMYYSATEGGLGIDEPTALSLVGAYGGFVYMMALLASFVGDRILGAERTLFYSAILVMIGHVVLALVPGATGLAIGLVCIGIGSGGVKTATQVVLGDLYTREDPRRDAGFSIFYMSVNIGGLLGPWLTGLVWGQAGFHWGFGLAAIGMAIGLVQYMLMRKSTIGAAGSEVPNPLPRSKWAPVGFGALAVAAIVVGLLTTGILPLDLLSWVVFAIALAATVILLWEMFASDKVTAHEKSRLTGYIPLLAGSVAFFAIFQSQFTVVALYTDQRANLDFFWTELEPSQVQSFNPLFIIIFAPIFAAMWTKLGERQWASATKFGVANIIIGLSLFIFLPYVGKGENSTPLAVLVLILFLFTMGELLLSPVGNSLATKVAPVAFKSRLFAVWLMSVSMGTALSGVLGSLYNPDDATAERTFFLTLSAITIALGVALIAISRWVVRKFGDVR